MEYQEIIFDNFTMYNPSMTKSVIDYYCSGYDTIVVKLNDGNMFLYDDVDNSIRRLPDDSNNMTEDECRREFKFRLRRLLSLNHMTQDELCEETGIHPVMLSRYMSGKTTPSFYIVDKIAKALNCSTDEFRYL